MKITLSVLALLCLVNTGQAYFFGRCRICNLAASLEECYTWAECDVKTEICYMDEVITQGAQIRFNGGCRAIDVCKDQPLGKRSADKRSDNTNAYVSCSRCCDDKNYCNEDLCGITKKTDMALCNSCDGAADGLHAPPPKYPGDCAIRTVCQRGQMCFASTIPKGTNELTHFTSCMKNHQCQVLVEQILNLNHDSPSYGLIGKREAEPICAVCCGDDMCNNLACEAIKGEMVYTLVLMALSFTEVSGLLTCLNCVAGWSCSTLMCQSNELCYTGDVIHHLKPARVAGCMSAHACRDMTKLLMKYMVSDSDAAAALVGKRHDKRTGNLHMCDICCGDDMCNKQSCNHIKSRLFSMYQAGTLNMTSLSLLDPTVAPVTSSG